MEEGRLHRRHPRVDHHRGQAAMERLFPTDPPASISMSILGHQARVLTRAKATGHCHQHQISLPQGQGLPLLPPLVANPLPQRLYLTSLEVVVDPLPLPLG